jgi:hypothetical protein
MREDKLESVLGTLGLARKDSSDWVAPTVGGFVVGALIGAGLGLLLAPQSGEKLRKSLRVRAEEAKDDLVSAFGTTEEDVRSERNGPPLEDSPNARVVKY